MRAIIASVSSSLIHSQMPTRIWHLTGTFIALTILLPGCATFGECEAGACSDDAKVTATVEARLYGHADLAPPDLLHVQTRNHVVYLYGTVSTALQSANAESVALQSQGVNRVTNLITVSQ
jgi:osmotically-inducible protein OsmY